MEQLSTQSDTPLGFLGQLNDIEMAALYGIGTRRHFAKNDFIFKSGQNDLNIYALARGRVKLYGSSAEGRDVLLWFALAGEVFGLAECLLETPRQISARAAEPCVVLCFSHNKFKSWLAAQPEIACRLMGIMAMRMRDLGHRFLSLANGNIQAEVAQLLIRLAATYGKRVGNHVHMTIPLTEQDIADMVGASRQGVSTCLAKMKREGAIDVAKHFFTIKELDHLQQIAKGPAGIRTAEPRAPERRKSGGRGGLHLWQKTASNR